MLNLVEREKILVNELLTLCNRFLELYGDNDDSSIKLKIENLKRIYYHREIYNNLPETKKTGFEDYDIDFLETSIERLKTFFKENMDQKNKKRRIA